MSKWDLIDSVIDNVKFICEKRQINLTEDEIRKRTLEWYGHTSYFDVDTLSALVLHSEYTTDVNVANMPEIRIKYYNELKV